MKKKILNFILTIMVLMCSIVLLTACNNDTKSVEKVKDEEIKVVSDDAKAIIQEFATSIENNNEDEFLNIIDLNSVKSITGYEITEKELKDLYENSAEPGNKYEVSDIEIATKSDVENILKSIGQDVKYKNIKDKCTEYELYSAKISTLNFDEMQDVFLLKKDGDDYIFATSIIWLGEISLEYERQN